MVRPASVDKWKAPLVKFQVLFLLVSSCILFKLENFSNLKVLFLNMYRSRAV